MRDHPKGKNGQGLPVCVDGREKRKGKEKEKEREKRGRLTNIGSDIAAVRSWSSYILSTGMSNLWPLFLCVSVLRYEETEGLDKRERVQDGGSYFCEIFHLKARKKPVNKIRCLRLHSRHE